MIEGKSLPAFGISVKRFAAVGYHPKLEVRPGTYKNTELSPSSYVWNKRRKIHVLVPSWKREAVTKEYSRRLGYRGDHIIKEKIWRNSVNGPGWHDVPSLDLTKGIVFPKKERFTAGKLKEFAVPGPGTYGKNHVPYARLEEKSHAKGFSFSLLPPFEGFSCAPRGLNVHRTYYLPPNLYNVKTPTEEFLSKRVSKRGPYDLFSGDRFPDPIVFKTSKLPLWLNPKDLSHRINSFKGKFLKCGKDSQMFSRLVLMDIALARKKEFDPGPSDYDPYPPPKVTIQTRAPFGMSVENARPVVRCDISAPPGRYNLETKRKIIGDGMKSAFRSKTKRSLPLPEKLSWFE